ncbi:MAG: hypothetical protein V1860_00400 [bacterium]
MKRRGISVLGPSNVKDGDWIAKQAFCLGELIAKAGYVCVNGGYGGVMEYVSRGAISAGGKVIGVTVKGIETKNPYLTEKKEMEFFPRLQYLLERPKIFFSPEGSKGTLLEFAAALVRNDAPTVMLIEGNTHWKLFDPLPQLWGDQNLMNISDVTNSAKEAVDSIEVAFFREQEKDEWLRESSRG